MVDGTPNFQSLNGYNSGAHWSISLKVSTEFLHVTANTDVEDQRVKGQGHSVRNRQHRFTLKMCRIFLLILRVKRWAWYKHVPSNRRSMSTWLVARQKFPKCAITQYFLTKNPESPENADNTQQRPARHWAACELQRFRNCMLSSLFLKHRK